MHTLETRPNGRAALTLEPTSLPPHRKRLPRWVLIALAALVLVVAGIVLALRLRASAAVQYATAPVARQTLVQSVTATGTLNAQNTIAVGTQVSGTISELDVDYNSRVHKGQVLAKLDPTTFQAALDQSRAQLAQAQAQAEAAAATASGGPSQIGSAQANASAAQATAQAADETAKATALAIAAAQSNVVKSQSALALAQQTVARDRSLLAQGYIAQSQLDTDQSNAVAAQTALDAAQASVRQAQAQASATVSQAAASRAQVAAQSDAAGTVRAQAANQAATANAGAAGAASAAAQVRQAQFNLERTIITSPVDGTVVARSVSVGQTVAASFQTPTLFTIAQDLSKMEVDLAVGESDIGNVKAGDSVDLTVLAFPNRTFHGIVSQVRINPTTTSNVVTYTTVVLVDNRGGELLPGMTANAQIHVARTDNALVVPAQALTYRPPAGAVARRRRPATAPTAGATAASPWGATGTGAGQVPAQGTWGRIFVQRDGRIVPVSVKVVLVSGTQAAVQPQGGTLAAGDAVVTGDSSTSVARAAAANGSRSPMQSRAVFGGGR